MKLCQKIGISIALLAISIACTPSQNDVTDNENKLNELKASFTIKTNTKKCDTTLNIKQLIVRYNKDLLENKEESLQELYKDSVRRRYKVSAFKKCPCGDPTLELWYAEKKWEKIEQMQSTLGVKKIRSKSKNTSTKRRLSFVGSYTNPVTPTSSERITPIPEDEPYIEMTEIDFDFDLFLEEAGFFSIANSNNIKAVSIFNPTLLVNDHRDISIASLDTGIKFSSVQTSPYLYNSIENDSTLITTQQKYSGWNFANNSSNTFDNNGHGTKVAKHIAEVFNHANTSFEILPVKVLDQNQDGSYFNILCGLTYAMQKPEIKFIHMDPCLRKGKIQNSLIQAAQSQRGLIIDNALSFDFSQIIE